MIHIIHARVRQSAGIVAAILVLNSAAPLVLAQSGAARASTAEAAGPRGGVLEGPATRAAITDAARRVAFAREASPESAGSGRSASSGRPGLATDIALGVGGAVAGLFVGGYVGDLLDRYALGGNHCGCDDPGLRGALWGAFIGAVALPVALLHWLG